MPEPTSPLDAAGLRHRVQAALESFLAEQTAVLAAVSPDLAPVSAAVRDFVLDGGKRLRPAFAYWGWRGAGAEDTDEVIAAVASLELLHACALIHDDVMDDSDTRRGQPAVHRRFAGLHRAGQWRGDNGAFGRSAALLVGDLCLVWADIALNTSGLSNDALRRARPTYDQMRVELMSGQYLDVLEQALGTGSIERALHVARFKSGLYTIERPLRLGGLLADADEELLSAYSSYGLPLGDAFQLRDDVLGVFGNPEETGKPAGDDLREGKRTVLVATALAHADAAQASLMERLLGDPALSESGVSALREVIVDTKALQEVEELIESRTAEALAGLAATPIDDGAREVLRQLAEAATARSV
jgi:geranylgeranyl diphosphate synthase type I